MPNSYSSGNESWDDAVGNVRDQASNAMGDAAETVSDAGRKAARKFDDGRQMAADGLNSAAEAVHSRADALPGGPRVQQFARRAADRLSGTADYVRSHDAQHMVSDVEDLVKKNPGPALLVAAAFGFLIGRAMSRD
jgi:ElaB/YqjD/DUF883 family membrane-anchored ribosome-binding protein